MREIEKLDKVATLESYLFLCEGDLFITEFTKELSRLDFVLLAKLNASIDSELSFLCLIN